MTEQQQPDPPWRVWAIAINHRSPRWWQQRKEGVWWYSPGVLGDALTQNLTVIDHDRNDPEAVEIIRRAKEKQ